MTDDFKKNLLDYISGNYEVSSGNNEPLFSEPTMRENKFYDKVHASFPNGFQINGNLQGQDANNNGVSYNLIYGKYSPTSSSGMTKGFVLILDNKFDIIQTITKYSSGTDISALEIMNVAEDGNFYGIENVGGTKRFIMLNNIVAKLPTENEFKIVLRQSYNLQGQSTNITQYLKIEKNPGESKYLFAGLDNNIYTIATELTINVGSENDWVDYTYTTNRFEMGDMLASWDSSGNLEFIIAGWQLLANEQYKFGILRGDSQVGQTMTLTTYGDTYQMIFNSSFEIESFTSVYFSAISYYQNACMIRHFKNGQIINVYDSMTYLIAQALIQIQKVDNEIFVLINEELVCRVGMIINDSLYLQEVYENVTYDPMFVINKQFNLHNIYVQDLQEVYNVKLIYNQLNYNGLPYKSLNSMVSNYVNLYDSNNIEIFSRNLYNRIVNNNTTTSTVDVPNSFVNDTTIRNKNLISQTNNILNTDTNDIVTNIYEELLINFINTLLMENRNNPNNIIKNDIGASRINISVSNPLVLDYDDAKATKYRINYADNTSETFNLYWNKISNYCQAKIGIFVKKPLVSIEILSEDELTIYQTITEVSELEVNNLYTVKQDLWILDKREAEQVYYDTDEVYYNDEPVYY